MSGAADRRGTVGERRTRRARRREACEAVRAAPRARAPASLVVIFASPETCAPAPTTLLAVIERAARARAPHRLRWARPSSATGREVEDGPALAVWAARLPGATESSPSASSRGRSARAWACSGWPAELERDRRRPRARSSCSPTRSRFPADGLLAQLNLDGRGVQVVGRPRLGRRAAPATTACSPATDVHAEGAVGVALRGAARCVTVVSQGCMPIGPGDGHHRRRGLDGPGARRHAGAGEARGGRRRPRPEERALAASSGLLAGLVINENTARLRARRLPRPRHPRRRPRRPARCSWASSVRVGQTMRFHVRDAALGRRGPARGAARGARPSWAATPRRGGLIFSCNGRGTRMFAAARPRRRGDRARSSATPGRRPVLQRGDRPGRRQELPARLHRHHGAVRRLRRQSTYEIAR